MNKRDYACCFIGHREIEVTEELKSKVTKIIENLIKYNNVYTFLFGSKSKFDSLCRMIVTELKEKKYPHIKRIYVRAEYPHIDADYENYLLQSFEYTYFPKRVENAGRAAYVRRNLEMIDTSKYCVAYYIRTYTPINRNSGTKIAYDYAIENGSVVINAAK